MRLCTVRIHLAAVAAVAVICTASSAMAGDHCRLDFRNNASRVTAGPHAPRSRPRHRTRFPRRNVLPTVRPAGNGSAHSFSSNVWAVGDYYQFQVSTLGQSQIGLVFDQTSSSTGPGNFKVQYSTNGTTFTDTGFTPRLRS